MDNMVDQFLVTSIKQCFTEEGFNMTESAKITSVLHDVRRRARGRLQRAHRLQQDAQAAAAAALRRQQTAADVRTFPTNDEIDAARVGYTLARE